MNIAQRTVRKRVDLGLLGGIFGNSAQAGKSVDTVNVHGTRTTDTLSARSSESKSRVELILDLDLQTRKKVSPWFANSLNLRASRQGNQYTYQSVEHHRATLREINLVCLELGLFIGDIGVLTTSSVIWLIFSLASLSTCRSLTLPAIP